MADTECPLPCGLVCCDPNAMVCAQVGGQPQCVSVTTTRSGSTTSSRVSAGVRTSSSISRTTFATSTTLRPTSKSSTATHTSKTASSTSISQASNTAPATTGGTGAPNLRVVKISVGVLAGLLLIALLCGLVLCWTGRIKRERKARATALVATEAAENSAKPGPEVIVTSAPVKGQEVHQ